MMTIDRFWSGAARHAGGVDVPALAQAAGGWQALRACDAAQLVELGVGPEVAGRWACAQASQTLGTAITLADPRYPVALLDLPRPPPVLYVEGDLAALQAPAVALVGTRRCTPYGQAVAHHLASTLADRGVVVVSGLARGIDTHAHRATLGRGATIAVLGHGLASTAPPSNRDLRQRVVAQGGAVVTGFPDDVGPARWTFPVRNAWIAALARATVVVEAPLRSGALITASEAASIGRPVFAVPGRLGEPNLAGCLELLAQGAGVVDDVERFADGFADPSSPTPHDPWLAHLLDGPTLPVLCRRVGRALPEVAAAMATLELQGRVVRLPGQRYVASGQGRVASTGGHTL